MIKYLGHEKGNLPQQDTAELFNHLFTATVQYSTVPSNSKHQIAKLLPQVSDDQIFFYEIKDIKKEQNKEQKPSTGPVTRSRSRNVRARPYPSTHQPTAPGSPEDTVPWSLEDIAPGSTRDTAPGSTRDTTPGSTRDTAPGSTRDTTPGSTRDTAPGSPEDTAPWFPEDIAPESPGECFSQNFDSSGSRVPQIQSLQNGSTKIWIISSDET